MTWNTRPQQCCFCVQSHCSVSYLNAAASFAPSFLSCCLLACCTERSAADSALPSAPLGWACTAAERTDSALHTECTLFGLERRRQSTHLYKSPFKWYALPRRSNSLAGGASPAASIPCLAYLIAFPASLRWRSAAALFAKSVTEKAASCAARQVVTAHRHYDAAQRTAAFTSGEAEELMISF